MPRDRFARSPLAALSREGGESFARALAGVGLAALILDPLIWLWQSWWDASYESPGAAVGAAVVALIALSLRSGPPRPDRRSGRLAWQLLGAAAVLRLLGRLLAVNVIGALALVIDVAALATGLGLARRPFALSPFGLAAFAAFALPIEHLLQRGLGHPLQLLATAIAHALLGPFHPTLVRQGTLLLHPSAELAIDLPCSGARGLLLFAGLLAAALCVLAPGRGSLPVAVAASFVGALAANVLRIVALFLGTLAGLPVAREPLHSAIGLAALALAALPLLFTLSRWPRRAPTRGALRDAAPARGQRLSLSTGAAIALAGLAIALAPGHPRDGATASAASPLPASLGARVGEAVALDPVEQRYSARHGGQAEKRVYRSPDGPATHVLRVRTNAPLRHLHDPADCLRGAGHTVTRQGVTRDAQPSVVYRSVDPDGRAWRVEASFVSDRNQRATGVSEVIWRWLEEPAVAWSLVERITPWPHCERDRGPCRDFDAALFRALDLPLDAPLDHDATTPAAPAVGAPLADRAEPPNRSIHARPGDSA